MHRSDLRLFSNCMSLGCRTCTLPCWNASRTAPQQMQMLLEGEKTSWVTHLPHENHQKSIRINQSLPPKSSQTSKSPDSGDLHLSDGWETPSSSLAPHFIGNMATHSSLAPSKHWIVVFTPTSSQIISNVPDSWVLHSSSCLVAPFNQHPPPATNPRGTLACAASLATTTSQLASLARSTDKAVIPALPGHSMDHWGRLNQP